MFQKYDRGYMYNIFDSSEIYLSFFFKYIYIVNVKKKISCHIIQMIFIGIHHIDCVSNVT